MKISLNHIRFYKDRYNWSADPVPDGIDALVQKIGAQLGAVEGLVDNGSRYKGAIIVKVVSCVPHENSDHLNICRVDDGDVTQNVERGEDGLVQVVCGAPNVHADMLAVWLPPGSTVPDSYGNEPFVLGSRELRGVVSNGMLASAKELALDDDHSGILEIDDDKKPGEWFADAYGLSGDYLIDIENKMFTHRPDCFGVMGVAREIAGIQGQEFHSPSWYTTSPEFPQQQSGLPLTVDNQLPELVPRFTAITMSNVTVKKSPLWLRIELSRYGVKTINNIVDFTNYYMLLTGQPLHAYDYDKVKALSENGEAKLVIRHPSEGETIALLNGKTIQPRSEAIMIASSTNLIGVGGIMGGSETEVDETTQNIILECANFDMYNIRRTSMAHGLFTDAVTRFNKGQSPLQNLAVLNKIVTDISDRGDAVVAGQVIDVNHVPQTDRTVTVSTQFINQRLGTSLQSGEIAQLLRNVEFTVDGEESLHITAPFWRTDIGIPEDIVEEVGRLYGFENLPRDLPVRSITPVKPDELLQLKSRVRRELARLGANELLTYSFVHGNLLDSVQQNKDLAFKIGNALSPDLQYYRLSITPSLLNHVHSNIKVGYSEFALFEIGKAHNKMHIDDDGGVPREYEVLALAYTSKHAKQPAYYQARAYLDQLALSFGIALEYRPIETSADYPVTNPFEHSRSALAYVAGSDIFLGIVGEYKTSVQKRLKLPAASAGFEIGLIELIAAKNDKSSYQPLSRFPHVSQDICLEVAENISFGELTNHLSPELRSRVASSESVLLSPIDIYTAPELEGKKRITYRVTLTSYERTLNDQVLGTVLEEVSQKLHQTLGAQRI